jgi:hypothetical protein
MEDEYNAITNPHHTDIVREEVRVLLQCIFLRPFLWDDFDCQNDELKVAVAITIEQEEREELLDKYHNLGYYILEIPALCTNPLIFVSDTVYDVLGSKIKNMWLCKRDLILEQIACVEDLEYFDYEDYYSNWLSNRLVYQDSNVFQRIKYIAKEANIDLELFLKHNMVNRSKKESSTPKSNIAVLSKAIDEFLYLHNEYKSAVQFKLYGYNCYGDMIIKLWMDETGSRFVLYNPRAIMRYFHMLDDIEDVIKSLKVVGVYKLLCPQTNIESENLHEMLVWYSENRIYPVHKMFTFTPE